MSELRERLAALRERLKVARHAPRILRLMWRAQPGLLIALAGLNLAQGLVPAANLWIGKLTIDAVVRAVRLRVDPGAAAAAAVDDGGLEESEALGAAGEALAGALRVGDVPGAGTVLLLIGVGLAVGMVGSALGPAMAYCQRQLGDYLAHEVQTRILTKSASLKDISYFENPAYYDMLRHAQHNDTVNAPIRLLNAVAILFRTAVQLASMLVVLARFSPPVALGAVLLAVPTLWLQLAAQHQDFSVARWNIAEARWMRYLAEVITSQATAPELRIFGLGEHFVQRYMDQFRTYIGRFGVSRRRYLKLNLVAAALTSLGFTGLYVYFAVEALFRRISLGDLTLYGGATLQAHQRILDLVRGLGGLYASMLFLSQLFDFLDAPPAMAEREEAAPCPVPMRRGIELRDVSFTYPGTERPVLERLNLAIRPGECVALVGENGAGKTTIVKLLGRLYDPTAGQILVDGTDLRDVDVEEWRRQIGAILQDFSRYHLPAKTNIGLGNIERLEREGAIQRAAARGGATTVVERLPQGYETMLGRFFAGSVQIDAGTHDGAELSGGEWQKVALSRAFMRADGEDGRGAREGAMAAVEELAHRGAKGDDAGGCEAQLLILDEPTAALDTQSEYDVYLRFRELTRGRATLLISHRFSTVRMADRIVVLEDGRVAEEGTHAELMARGGTYAELYEKQASRYR